MPIKLPESPYQSFDVDGVWDFAYLVGAVAAKCESLHQGLNVTQLASLGEVLYEHLWHRARQDKRVTNHRPASSALLNDALDGAHMRIADHEETLGVIRHYIRGILGAEVPEGPILGIGRVAQLVTELRQQLAERQVVSVELANGLARENARNAQHLLQQQQAENQGLRTELEQRTEVMRDVQLLFAGILGSHRLVDIEQGAEQVRNLVDRMKADLREVDQLRDRVQQLQEEGERVGAIVAQIEAVVGEQGGELAAQVIVLAEALAALLRRTPGATERAQDALTHLHPAARALRAEVQRGRALVRETERLRRIEEAAQAVLDEHQRFDPAEMQLGSVLRDLADALRQPRLPTYLADESFPPIPASRLEELVARLRQHASDFGAPFPWGLGAGDDQPGTSLVADHNAHGEWKELARLTMDDQATFWLDITSILNRIVKEFSHADQPA